MPLNTHQFALLGQSENLSYERAGQTRHRKKKNAVFDGLLAS